MDREILVVIVTVGGSALIGAVSYLVKSLYGWSRARQMEKASQIARLYELVSLLRTSKSLFLAHNEQRDRLYAWLAMNHPDEFSDEKGFEATFTRMFDLFSQRETELHGIIRNITKNSVRDINLRLSQWLEGDQTFKTSRASLKNPHQLSRWLHHLELHLSLWHAKYEYWMEDPRHALVYLADEVDHGVGFPTGIEAFVEETLKALGQPMEPVEVPVEPVISLEELIERASSGG